MKLGNLYNSHASLKVLANKPLKMKVAVKLTLFLKKTASEIEVFAEKEKQLAEKLGEKTERGFHIPVENMPEFEKEMNEVGNIELEINPPSISLDDLPEKDENGNDVYIEPAHLLNLDWLIKDEDEKENETDN